MKIDDALSAELDVLLQQNQHRYLRRVDSVNGPQVMRDGRALVSFGSNDYLGLAGHPEVRAAAARAAQEWGGGSTGSRLTTGDFALHESLEAELAAEHGTEAALLFSSGYAANLGIIPALAGPQDLILSDALNHASLIDGCRLSRSVVRVYSHGDCADAQELLSDRASFRRALLVTDGVFSMDGDIAPLPELADLCARNSVWLMVDDAHGTGVLGPQGQGTVAHFGLQNQVPVQMGTISKALGSSGGFVCGSTPLIDWLRSRARSFVYSTASNPAASGAALAALHLLRAEPDRQQRLLFLASHMRSRLRDLGLNIPQGITPIIPVIVGDSATAMHLSLELEQHGFWIPAIRPPTVPEGSARLRLTVSAAHTDEDVEGLLTAMGEITS